MAGASIGVGFRAITGALLVFASASVFAAEVRLPGDPTDPGSYADCDRLYEEYREADGARQAFEHGLQAAPRNALAWFYLGEADLQLGRSAARTRSISAIRLTLYAPSSR